MLPAALRILLGLIATHVQARRACGAADRAGTAAPRRRLAGLAHCFME
jgi:hypothetical protein